MYKLQKLKTDRFQQDGIFHEQYASGEQAIPPPRDEVHKNQTKVLLALANSCKLQRLWYGFFKYILYMFSPKTWTCCKKTKMNAVEKHAEIDNLNRLASSLVEHPTPYQKDMSLNTRRDRTWQANLKWKTGDQFFYILVTPTWFVLPDIYVYLVAKLGHHTPAPLPWRGHCATMILIRRTWVRIPGSLTCKVEDFWVRSCTMWTLLNEALKRTMAKYTVKTVFWESLSVV